MKRDRVCEHCGEAFPQIEGRVFSNHVRWCPKNTENGDKGRSAISKANLAVAERKFGSIKTANCKICGNEIIGGRIFVGSFCSKSCANSSRTLSEETKAKIAKSLRKPKIVKQCPRCGNGFTTKSKHCSNACAAAALQEWKRAGLSEYQKYRADCRFKFSLSDYPDRFDFSLIEEHGWYKASNRGDNPNGISRDHAVSIKYGWQNGIPAEVIAHPANCILLQHGDNRKKQTSCSMTIDELMRRIDNW